MGRPDYGDLTELIIDEDNSRIAAWAAVVCSILGIIGNVLTVWVLLGRRALRVHVTTPFLLSLAVSDLIFCGFNLPLMARRFFTREWGDEWATCKWFPFFFYANISISAFSMAGVAVNRYVGIIHPARMAAIFSWPKSSGYVLLVWAVSFGFMAIPLNKIWGQLGYEHQIFNCTIMQRNDRSPMTFFLLVGFFLPCIVMTYCYSRLYWRVRQVGDQMRNHMDQDVTDGVLNRHMKRRERAVTRTTLWVWLAYVLCFLPTVLIMVFDPMPPNSERPGLHVAGYIIFWCSGFINPIIYIVSNRNYRRSLKSTMCCAHGEDDFETTSDEHSQPSSALVTFLSRSSTRNSGQSSMVSFKSRSSSRGGKVKSRPQTAAAEAAEMI